MFQAVTVNVFAISDNQDTLLFLTAMLNFRSALKIPTYCIYCTLYKCIYLHIMVPNTIYTAYVVLSFYSNRTGVTSALRSANSFVTAELVYSWF